LNLWENKI